MANMLGQYAVVAVVMLALLAGCTTDSDDQSRIAGAGSTSGTRSGEGVVRPPPLLAPESFATEVAVDRVFFDVDKSELSPEARRRIERWAAWMQRYPDATLTIEGHCDERGTREYNLGLGERRATATRDYLASLGVDARRLTTVSYGKERPAVIGSSESAWAQNRRAVAIAAAP